MRRTIFRLAAAVGLSALGSLLACPWPQAHAQGAGTQVHEFLYGAWTGGLFPPPSTVTAEQCLGAPTVIFARELVLHASFTDVLYVQRVIVTVSGSSGELTFHFAPINQFPAGAGTPGLAGAMQGLGCDNPDELRVVRLGPNEISFRNCKDFPFRLVRCPAGG